LIENNFSSPGTTFMLVLYLYYKLYMHTEYNCTTVDIKFVLPDRLVPDFHVAPPDNSPENQKMWGHINGLITSYLLARPV
jgi:hypothetical protein